MSEVTEPVFDLNKAIFDKIEEVGIDEAAAFFGRTKSVLGKWQSGTALPDLPACQKILDEAFDKGLKMPVFDKPPEQGQTIPDPAPTLAMLPNKRTTTEGPKVEQDPVKAMEKARTFSILSPVNREMSYATVLSMLGNWKATLPEAVRELLAHMDFEPDTTPHMARNRLATRFLEKGDEWSFWMDTDIIAPIGNPAWFKRRTGTKHADQWFSRAAIERLTTRGKTFVGAVYSQRSADRKILASPGVQARNEAEKLTVEEIRSKGPQDRIVEVEWVGFGCVAVHRRVFEDILTKVAGVKSSTKDKAHEFFTPVKGGDEGEDMAFCHRAKQAGHPVFLDLGVHCGHIGKFAFMP
jgi:hypothetical protein